LGFEPSPIQNLQSKIENGFAALAPPSPVVYHPFNQNSGDDNVPIEMDEQLFRRYSELKQQIAGLDEELRALQPGIMEQLKPLQDARLNTSFGAFSILRKSNWTYSEAVLRIEEQVKARQRREKTDGIAKVEYTEYEQFKPAATPGVKNPGLNTSR
jgi:hypothetical protein